MNLIVWLFLHTIQSQKRNQSRALSQTIRWSDKKDVPKPTKRSNMNDNNILSQYANYIFVQFNQLAVKLNDI